VDADYRRPADVLLAIHELLGGKYMWGSDHPFMSWNDGTISVRFTYRDEAQVLAALPEDVRRDMTSPACTAWLFGR
jgi:hypothetical protein